MAARTVRLGGKDHDVSALSAEGQRMLAAYDHATERLNEAKRLLAVLTRAKNAYIADLKNEIIEGRTGVDLGALFDE